MSNSFCVQFMLPCVRAELVHSNSTYNLMFICDIFCYCVCTLSRRPEWSFADAGVQRVGINTVCLIFMTFGFSQGRVFISFKSCLWWAKSPVLVSSILTATLFGVCCIPDVEGLGILQLKHNF